jgi:hypothetical protein
MCALAVGCATSDDPAGNDTDTDPTVTASFTTTDPSGSPTNATNDTNDTNDTNGTTGSADSTGGDATATGATGSTGSDSTGDCPVGTEGCPCNRIDPACEATLSCVDGTCVVPECPADVDEPNELQGEAIQIADINDATAPQQHLGTLSGTDDIDWWSYHCDDSLLQGLNPVQTLTPATTARFCVFMDCDIGGNPLITGGCPAGTVEDTAPLDFLPGCCSTDGAEIDLSDYNCPDSSDDSLTIYFRVDEASEDVCVDYTIDFEC